MPLETVMENNAPCQGKQQPWAAWALLFLLLAVAAWGTRYWLSPSFGLYEDDLTFIPSAIEADFAGVMEMISGYFSTLDQQGRPLMWSWVVLFAHLGWQVGGLQGMYLLGFSIWLTNMLLFVLLLRRIQGSFLLCAIGGFAYLVFSADTTQAFLFNAFGLQTAVLLFLLSLHLSLSQSALRWLAYPVLALVMLNYETPFLLFLAAPLLTKANGRRLKKRLLTNTSLVAVIFFGIYLLRLAAGDQRASSLGFPEMVLIPLRHMAIGPFVGLGAYFLRPLQVLRGITLEQGLAALAASAAFFLFLLWVRRGAYRPGAKLLPLRKGWWSDLPPEARRELRLTLAGVLMLVMAYPLTVILRPYAISGRATRVHLAAVIGAALILASLASLIFRSLRKRGLRILFLGLLALLLGLNFAFGFVVQRDYQRAWQLQQEFWGDLIPLIQDVQEGIAILVEPAAFQDVLQIGANTWNLPRVLPQLYHFPEDWAPPRVFRLIDGWQNNIVRLPGYFTLDGSNVYASNRNFGDFVQKQTIFISAGEDGLTRRVEPLPLNGLREVKPVGEPILSDFPTRPLYELLMQGNRKFPTKSYD